MEINAKEAYEMTKKIKNNGASKDWNYIWKCIHKAVKKGKFNCSFSSDEFPHIPSGDVYDALRNKGYDVTIRRNSYVFRSCYIDVCWDITKED